MGNVHRGTAPCAWCNRVRSASLVPLGQSQARAIAVVARLNSFESGRQRHFATVVVGDSEAVARNERLTDELSTPIPSMDKEDIRPAFDAQNQVFGDFEELCDRVYCDAEFLSRLEAAE